MEKLRILLADDHALMRDGLTSLIGSQTDMEVVGGASDGNEALELVAATAPDIVLMDISMPTMDGIRATHLLKERHPQVKVLALTAYENPVYLRQLLAAGASGFILKRMAARELIGAIRCVAAGDRYLDPQMQAEVERMPSNEGRLRGAIRRGVITDREQEVLVLIARGYTNKEISARLGISVKTVEVHKGNIMAKLELSNRADVVRYALSRGWLQQG